MQGVTAEPDRLREKQVIAIKIQNQSILKSMIKSDTKLLIDIGEGQEW